MNEVALGDIDEQNIEKAKELQKITQKLLKRLNMSDWFIRLAYCPKEDCEIQAEVEKLFAFHKSAKIICYTSKEEEWEEILFHELMHCKLGIITKNYDEALEKMSEIIQNLIQNSEETLVGDLTSCFYKGGKK